VFANIRIVRNEFGLLDGKRHMAALGFCLHLSTEPTKTVFSIRNRPLMIHDTGGHIFCRLQRPRLFRRNETGLAVTRHGADERLVATQVRASCHHGA
jgi:hypothetical protein